MSDPRFIPPSDRGSYPSPTEIEEGDLVTRCRMLFAHAAFMDERDARQRDLIRRLADGIRCKRTGFLITHPANSGYCGECSQCQLVAEARGIEATNE